MLWQPKSHELHSFPIFIHVEVHGVWIFTSKGIVPCANEARKHLSMTQTWAINIIQQYYIK